MFPHRGLQKFRPLLRGRGRRGAASLPHSRRFALTPATIQRFNDLTIQRFNDSTVQRFNRRIKCKSAVRTRIPNNADNQFMKIRYQAKTRWEVATKRNKDSQKSFCAFLRLFVAKAGEGVPPSLK